MKTEAELLKASLPEIVAYFSPYCRHVALSEEHAKIEAAKAEKKLSASLKKQAKVTLAEEKAREKEMLSKLTPEMAKQYRKNKKAEKLMANEPKLL